MRKLALAFLLISSGILAACGGDDATGPATFDGTYDLVSINASPLPYAVTNTAQLKEEFVSMFITLKADGTYSLQLVFRTTEAGKAPALETESGNGTWVRTGDKLVLTEAGEVTNAVIAGDTFVVTIQDEGTFVFKFQKRK